MRQKQFFEVVDYDDRRDVLEDHGDRIMAGERDSMLIEHDIRLAMDQEPEIFEHILEGDRNPETLADEVREISGKKGASRVKTVSRSMAKNSIIPRQTHWAVKRALDGLRRKDE